MRQVMVRYTVRPECADENTRLIQGVFESLDREAPSEISYASYRLDDGVSFVHIATMRDAQHNPLRTLAAFQEFVESIRERCTVLPVTTVLNEVGSYARMSAEVV